MLSQNDEISRDDPRLNQILAEYLQAVEAGHPPDEEELLEQYPEFADQLREFFADKRGIDEIVRPDADEAASPVAAAERVLEMPTLAPNQPTSPDVDDVTIH